MLAPLIDVLLDARGLCADPDGDFTWSSWRDQAHALEELDEHLSELRRTARKPWGLSTVFAPTGPMQELALSSGWGTRFLDLAARYDQAVVRLSFLTGLPERLAEQGADFERATQPPEGSGIEVQRWSGPRATLTLTPAVDARELATAWGLTAPIAISGDVHQRRFTLWDTGERLEDPHNHRVAAVPVEAAGWWVQAALTERPRGDLPGVVAGASPAYPVREYGGLVAEIEVRPAP